nr:hypothetical protein JVH1_1804 [Rhodococcus sp. JVH1]
MWVLGARNHDVIFARHDCRRSPIGNSSGPDLRRPPSLAD